MFKFSVLEVLVAVSIFGAVATKPDNSEPKLSEFFDLESFSIRIGDDIKDARIIENVNFAKTAYGSAQFSSSNYTVRYEFPSLYTIESSLGKVIRKVVVLVEKFNDKQTVKVEVVRGGVYFKYIELKIDVTNVPKLNYRVILYGQPSY